MALWKNGRSWDYQIFWPDYDPHNCRLTFDDPDDKQAAENIARRHPNAVILNSWHTNVGPIGESMTVRSLINSLTWQYGLQHNMLSDAIM